MLTIPVEIHGRGFGLFEFFFLWFFRYALRHNGCRQQCDQLDCFIPRCGNKAYASRVVFMFLPPDPIVLGSAGMCGSNFGGFGMRRDVLSNDFGGGSVMLV